MNSTLRIAFAWFLPFFFLGSCSETSFQNETQTGGRAIWHKSLTSQNITSFCEDPWGYIWIGTDNGLNKYNGREYLHFFDAPNSDPSLYLPSIKSLWCDSQGYIWVISSAGAHRIERDNGVKTYPVSTSESATFLENHNGDILYYSGKDLFIHDKDEDRMVLLLSGVKGKVLLSSSGELWVVGTEEICCLAGTELRKVFSFPVKIAGRSVCDMDGKDNIRIVSESGALLFSTRDHTLRNLPGLEKMLSGDSPRQILPFDGATFLILTEGGRILQYDFLSDKVISGDSLPFYLPVSGRLVTCLMTDSNSNLWYGMRDGGFYLTKQDKTEHNPIHFCLHGYSVQSLVEKDGRIWVRCSPERFFRLDPSENFSLREVSILEAEANAQELFLQQKEAPLFEGHRTSTVEFTSSQGEVWASVKGRGLFKYDRSSMKMEVVEEGHPFLGITSILEDNRGFLWLFSLTSIMRYNPQSGQLKSYEVPPLPDEIQLNEGACIRLSTGNIACGTSSGLFIFNPLKHFTSSSNLHLNIESLTINNLPISPAEDNSALKEDILYSNSLRLDYSQRNFSLGFNVPFFNDVPPVRYFYRMSGVERDFIESSGNIATYTNLQYGSHLFTVKTFNSDTDSFDNERSLEIDISRPWWLSIPALVLYSILALSVILSLQFLSRRANENKMQAAMAQQRRLQEQELYQRNMNMFANIAHEFRTPLTMISASVETLSAEKSSAQEVSRLHSIIRRNSGRMLKLVSQLLDFNKIENNLLTLSLRHCSPGDIVDNICASFHFGALQKDLSIEFDHPSEEIVVPLDPDKFEKIVYNLLSNAVKFSNMGGKITLSMRLCDETRAHEEFPQAPWGKYLLFQIADNGIGISPKEDDRLFERYYRSSRTESKEIGGTGLGLYMCKQLTLLHKGMIKASPRSDGSKGAVFTFILPSEDKAYPPEAFTKETGPQQERHYAEEMIFTPVRKSSPDRPTLMVVDDDYEMLYFLQEVLSRDYNVRTFYNATTAYSSIETVNPDLILSDVLMLEMDGFKFCELCKRNIAYSHIPFVLLTAKSTIEDQVEGLTLGANAYVTKPFSPEYLCALIRSQINNASNARKKVNETLFTEEISNYLSDERDRQFIEDFYKVMEEEISDPELNISVLTEKLGIGKTSLYNKVKKLTGETPNALFRKYKLNHSLKLLRSSNYKISAIAESIGFTPSYFSRIFQKEFGVLPSEYILGPHKKQ